MSQEYDCLNQQIELKSVTVFLFMRNTVFLYNRNSSEFPVI